MRYFHVFWCFAVAAVATGIDLRADEPVSVADCGDSFQIGLGPNGEILIPPLGFNFITFCSAYLQQTITKTVTSTSTRTISSQVTNQPSLVSLTLTRTGTVSRTSVVTSTVNSVTTVVVTSRTSKPWTSTVTTIITVTLGPPTTTTSKTSSTTSKTSLTTSKTSTTTSSKTTTSSTPTGPGIPEGSLCPAKGATGLSCGIKGWGYAENNIYYAQPVAAAACHQLCLANSECLSFQVQDSSVSNPECNLYRAAIASNTVIQGDSPFIFYDRDCADYSPSTCNQKRSPEPAPTAAPDFNNRERGLAKKAEAIVSIPAFLSGLDPDVLEQLCQCIVPNEPPPAVISTTVTKTSTSVLTSTVGGGVKTTTVVVSVGVTNVVLSTTVVGGVSTVTRTSTITG